MSETPRFDLFNDLRSSVLRLLRVMNSLDEAMTKNRADSRVAYPGIKASERIESYVDFEDIEDELLEVLKFGVRAQSWIDLQKQERNYASESEVSEFPGMEEEEG